MCRACFALLHLSFFSFSVHFNLVPAADLTAITCLFYSSTYFSKPNFFPVRCFKVLLARVRHKFKDPKLLCSYYLRQMFMRLNRSFSGLLKNSMRITYSYPSNLRGSKTIITPISSDSDIAVFSLANSPHVTVNKLSDWLVCIM